MTHKHSVTFLIFIALILFAVDQTHGQCRNFAKKECMPNLEPFIPNGQTNSTSLSSGERAELLFTFYSGTDYRLLVCGGKSLKGLHFEVKDSHDNLVFTSKGEDIDHWDFNVDVTQQLQVAVIVPPHSSSHASSRASQYGCAALVLGFREY